MASTDLLRAAIFLSLLATASADIQFTKSDMKLDDPNTCYSDNYSNSLGRGDTNVYNRCEFKKCIYMDGELFWADHKCDQIFQSNGCTLKQDTSKLYPDCCPKPSC